MNPVSQESNACVRKRGWIYSVLNLVRFIWRNTLRCRALRVLVLCCRGFDAWPLSLDFVRGRV